MKYLATLFFDNMYNFSSIHTTHAERINQIFVTQFAKTCHNAGFLEIQIIASVNSIHLKLYSVVISMLYCKYFLSYKAIDSKKSNIFAILQQIILHVFNYMIISYGYFNIQSWENDHST